MYTDSIAIKFELIKANILFLLLFLGLMLSAQAPQSLAEKLESMPEVVSVKTINNNPFFNQTLMIEVKQPIDHNRKSRGWFTQRVFVSDVDFSRPTVFVTEGYGAGYAEDARYINELCPILSANQIVVEHRYFNSSTPEGKLFDWQYLTVDNAAADHHRIVELLKPIFTGKWVSTGISKGGQTTLYHRVLYPEDVDVAVPYVAPINYSFEDGREQQFLQNVSTDECRTTIRRFLIDLLDRRADFQPLMVNLIKNQKLTFALSDSAVFDYCILEFPFAFFQWGTSCADIPLISDSDIEKFSFFMKISSPEYFSIEGSASTRSFFYQAGKELGYYSYNVAPYAGLLSIESAENYLYTIFTPEEAPCDYDFMKMHTITASLMESGNNILYIYGEWDPWSASAITPSGNTNALKLVNPKGCHASRILSLPPDMQQRAYDSLSVWLETPVPFHK